SLRVAQRIAAGELGETLAAGEAARIFTGAPLPEGADAVVIQEDCQQDGDQVRFRGPVAAGDNVRPRGNDIVAGHEVLAAGTRLRPQELGLAASVGLAELDVVRRLRVAIFSSGDELVQPGEPLAAGAIYNSNRYILRGLLSALDCETIDLGSVEDSLAATEEALVEAAAEADVVVTSGGMSVGDEDHVKQAVERAGRLEMWRVAVKPGKPLAFGRIATADFIGLPGNPVSTLLTFCLFVRPFLLRRQGVREVLGKALSVPAAFRWPRPERRCEYLRARLEQGSDGVAVNIYPKQGSDVLTSTVWADGLVEIRAGDTIEPGDLVPYYSFAELIF
ncbi:MAG: molybdopterin molybdotransferase MoeA, partial [Gammaproteobacteria bacterium]|nr:molybdopterin molybdotransferase MoeA [Gammaproteobacteria bacterium]